MARDFFRAITRKFKNAPKKSFTFFEIPFDAMAWKTYSLSSDQFIFTRFRVTDAI
jgi:hypothetical protein